MRGRLAASLLGGVVLGLVGLGIGLSVRDIGSAEDYELWIVLGSSLFGLASGLLFTSFTLAPAFRWVTARIAEVPFRVLVSGTLGLIVGLVIAALVLSAFSVSDLPGPWDIITPALVSVTMMLVGLAVGTTRAGDLFQLTRLGARGPTTEIVGVGPEEQNGRVILVDTSAIIDGRIAEIAHTGFMDRTLLIPKFVLEELQYVADSPDSLKRSRGRRGLEVLSRLRKDHHVDVQITDLDVPGGNGVDSKLVTLAKSSNYALLTTDFNLNKVAELQGIRVLNVNDLANSLKPTLLPGEDMPLHITQEGKDDGQGVGFLDDGTMVVVEGGSKYVNSQVPVVITRVLQTSAGRIIFAHLK